MLLKQFTAGPFATHAYFVGCDAQKVGIFIDPAPSSASMLMDAAKGYDVQGIYLTHTHWDHIGDAAKLNLPTFVHKLDAPNLEKPGSDGLPLAMPIEGVKPAGFLENGQKIAVGDLEFEVIFTPGHSPGGVSFYFESENVLISGDTLFCGSIGNISFPTSNAQEMWKSLKTLSQLPPTTKVYPGHGDNTSIGNETWLNRAEEIFG